MKILEFSKQVWILTNCSKEEAQKKQKSMPAAIIFTGASNRQLLLCDDLTSTANAQQRQLAAGDESEENANF